jgi:hypothetical protein
MAEKITFDRAYLMNLQYHNDTWFLAYNDDPIKVFTSSDGYDWMPTLPIPVYEGPLSFGTDIVLIHNSNTIGVIWKRIPYKTLGSDEVPEFTFMKSVYEKGRWSEPQVLIHRENGCILNDGVLLEDGRLILLWEEGKGLWNIVYRAVIIDGDVSIDQVMEPTHPFYTMRGISLMGDDEKIWCIFQYRGVRDHIYVSESIDGISWSDPASLSLPVDIRDIIDCSNGEVGALQYDMEKITLNRSHDWDTWKEELIMRLDDPVFFYGSGEDKGILSAACAVNEHGQLLVAYGTKFGIFTAFCSEELYQEQQSLIQYSQTLSMVQWILIVSPVLVYLWMWKKGSGTVGSYVLYYGIYVCFLIVISLLIGALIPPE